MDTRRMPYILAIVESEGNLTKAAEKMFISQPALSQILKKVEDEHGVKLFDRRKNPMSMTAAGRLYVRTARAVKDLSDSMQSEFDDERNLERGELRIGVTPFRATYLLPRVLASYHRKYPGIDVVLQQARNSDLMRLMGEARTDLTSATSTTEAACPSGSSAGSCARRSCFSSCTAITRLPVTRGSTTWRRLAASRLCCQRRASRCGV